MVREDAVSFCEEFILQMESAERDREMSSHFGIYLIVGYGGEFSEAANEFLEFLPTCEVDRRMVWWVDWLSLYVSPMEGVVRKALSAKKKVVFDTYIAHFEKPKYTNIFFT